MSVSIDGIKPYASAAKLSTPEVPRQLKQFRIGFQVRESQHALRALQAPPWDLACLGGADIWAVVGGIFKQVQP